MTEYTTEKCKRCGYSGADPATGICYRLACREELLESENAKLKQENERLRKALQEVRNRQGKSIGGGK